MLSKFRRITVPHLERKPELDGDPLFFWAVLSWSHDLFIIPESWTLTPVPFSRYLETSGVLKSHVLLNGRLYRSGAVMNGSATRFAFFGNKTSLAPGSCSPKAAF